MERSASTFSLSIASTLGIARAVAVRGVLDQVLLGLLEALGHAAAGLLDGLHRRVVLLVWVVDLHAGVLPAPAQAETAAGRRTKRGDHIREPLRLVLCDERVGVVDLLERRVRHVRGEPARVLEREELVLLAHASRTGLSKLFSFSAASIV